MALTDLKIKNLASSDKDQWFSDEKGLRLLLKKNGAKYWRLKYRYRGKQKTLALGVYPDVSLKQARKAVIKAKELLEEGVDPAEERKGRKQWINGVKDESFEKVAEEWWIQQKGTWSVEHAATVWKRLRDNALEDLGELQITEIKPKHIIGVIRQIEKRDALDLAQRVLQHIRRVCAYAVQTDRIEINPASELSEVVKTRRSRHRPSLPREELPAFLKALNAYEKQGRQLTALSLKLLLLTFVRPGELRNAEWNEFDLEKGIWRIPGARMKMKTPHEVPLSCQAVEVIDRIWTISGTYRLVFPSERDRETPMSDNTMRLAMFRMGYDGEHPGRSKATPHGFRATASSILNESGFNPDAIERQLSHEERNGVRAAYIHHARYMNERQELMQWWADYLDGLTKAQANK